jgi:hypothetical protein
MTTNKKQPKNNHNGKPRQVFRFCYHPYSNTIDGKLIAYLQQGYGERSSKEMVLQALRMCWLPLAYKAQADSSVDVTDSELRRIGLICCHSLEQHLAYLRMELGLPHKSTDILPVPLCGISNPQTLAALFGLDAGNFTSHAHTNDNFSSQSQNISNNNSHSQPQPKIDSDAFIPGQGSFHDHTDDMFEDI